MSDDVNQHLSRISTMWTMVFQAHKDAPQAAAAQAVLLERYCGAIYRYLLSAVRDANVADELAQEFALRFVKGYFRRASPERVAMILTIGDLELDREKKRVSRASRPVDLGPTEFRLLEYLMERPGRVFSREQLLDGVWGSEVYIDERTVDVHVGRLRKALNRGQGADPIRTVRGAGYALDDRFGKAS